MTEQDYISIGVDIVSTERIAKNIADTHFLSRVFTEKEIQSGEKRYDTATYLAGRIAAKESISKALAVSWENGICWKDIEIINNDNGVPKVELCGEPKKRAEQKHVQSIQISISHEKEYAVAFALLIKR